MTYQLVIVALLFCFSINLYLNLRLLKRPKTKAKLPENPPLVSILIPVRNEELNIKNCLDSLLKQDYPNFEIIVLDDGSSDNTYEVVRQYAHNNNKVRLFKGEPLADGWAGKPFACYQLAQKAKGDRLLFVDADTIHTPDMLRGTIGLALETKAGLISGFPRQIATSIYQQIAIPVLYFVILGWLPLWWIHNSRKLMPSLAIGQFLLFSKDTYQRMGGHRAVKSRILEDVWLGIEVTRVGGKHIAIDLSDVTSCNMYRGLAEMSEGFVRWIYSVASLSPFLLGLMIIAGYFFYLAPFFWLWQSVHQEYSFFLILVIGFQVFLIYARRYLLDSRFKNSLVSTLCHPIGFIFLFLSCFRAIWQQLTGRGIYWKHRLYDKESTVK